MIDALIPGFLETALTSSGALSPALALFWFLERRERLADKGLLRELTRKMTDVTQSLIVLSERIR